MKTLSALLVAFGVVFNTAVHVRVMAGRLERPSLALPEGTSTEKRQQILYALSDKEAKYLEGSFINASTTLEFGGSTDSLNRTLTRLWECNYFQIKIRSPRHSPALGGPKNVREEIAKSTGKKIGELVKD